MESLGWIWTENLRPLLELLGKTISCRFDESDWAAFDGALVGTNSERGPWFEYPLGQLSVRVAFEPGADEMVSVAVTGDTAPIADSLQWIADLLRDYSVQARGN